MAKGVGVLKSVALVGVVARATLSGAPSSYCGPLLCARRAAVVLSHGLPNCGVLRTELTRAAVFGLWSSAVLFVARLAG